MLNGLKRLFRKIDRKLTLGVYEHGNELVGEKDTAEARRQRAASRKYRTWVMRRAR